MHDTATDAEKTGAKLGEDGGVVSETVKAEASRIIDRLMSPDPDFNDCEEAAALIRRLSTLIMPAWMDRRDAPKHWTDDAQAGYVWGWNACRAAMLTGTPVQPHG